MSIILKKIKLDADGKVSVVYHEPDNSTGSATKDVIERTSDRTPHPDLTAAIKTLTPFLTDSNALRPHRDWGTLKLTKPEIKKMNDLGPILDKLDEFVFSSVIPSGIAISGNDEHTAVVITGKHMTGNTAVAMNSPKISLNGDTWGFEQGIEDALETILEEARLFIVEKKSAQLQMDFDEKAKAQEKVEA